MTTSTAILPSDWNRNPGIAMRTARRACFEHESLNAYIDVCPPQNSEGLFAVDEDAWAIAKLYTGHDTLEGVQYRDQMEIESAEEMPVVVRELVDVCYEQYAEDIEMEERESPEPGLTVPEDWEGDAEHKTVDEF
jgi:hypothetical protein